MSTLFSNQTKALLVTEDIHEEGVGILKEDCFVVQHFSYCCERARDGEGRPYGPTVTSFLDFTVRVSSDERCGRFYDRIASAEAYPFSFLFNACFNETGRFSGCDDAMVARGYLCDIQEVFETLKTEDGSQEQVLLHCCILLNSISYLGDRDAVLKLMITLD